MKMACKNQIKEKLRVANYISIIIHWVFNSKTSENLLSKQILEKVMEIRNLR